MRWPLTRRRSLGLAALLLAAGTWAVPAIRASDAATEVHHLSSFRWKGPGKDWGGFSGLELSADGRNFTAITDRGQITSGTITRRDARITRVASAPLRPLAQPTPGRRVVDSEGLAQRADGRLYVSLEGPSAVWTYPKVHGPQAWITANPAFRAFSRNRGLEALALAPDGSLVTMAEGGADRIQCWRWSASGGWRQIFSLPRRDGFVPVGADYDDRGRLYVLERNFRGLLGFAARLRRFEADGSGEQILFTTPPGRHDNLEAVALWRSPSGALRATLLSDDNHFWFQRTELVDYALPN